MGAKEVLDTVQSLYETHKATTYPRTDCQYLPLSQRGDAFAVLAAMVKTDTSLTELVKQADKTRTSRVWNDAKITAHHGIIPTMTPFDIAALSVNELKIYDLIRRRYLAQWFGDYMYKATHLEVGCAGSLFVANGVTPVTQGWKVVYTALDTNAEKDDNDSEDDDNRLLPVVAQDEAVTVDSPVRLDKKTKPPAHYTEGTLDYAMINIGRSVEDKAFKSILKETAGIGTVTTRPNIFDTLAKREYIIKQGKKKYLISTERGKALIDLLPDEIKSPITTALWEQQLDEIANNKGSLNTFMTDIEQFVTQIIVSAKAAPVPSAPLIASDPNAPTCPKCAGAMRKRKGKNGEFYSCLKYPECNGTAAIASSTDKTCPKCGKVLRLRKGTKEEFYGCTGYPECKHTENVEVKKPAARKRKGASV